MTSRTIDRRTCISTGAKVCGLCVCARIPLVAWAGDEPIDPKRLNFCGYSCPEDCKFYEGTLDNNVELKREAWELWKIEERFGVEFDEEQAICYSCKALDKPEGIVLKRCSVRACAREKELDCCIECDELTDCDKDLWRRFPKFKQQVVEMQEKYRAHA
ncbi:MAG: DUF3795 domain-containing protein [Acidobacteriota bacterium]